MIEETLDFTVDVALLHSIIKSQAGTLGKALLEGVMNSIDAGATGLTVTLDVNGFSLKDDGRGFQSREEIEKWFRKFGTPHEEGDATYGRFRIGRGQMMAFATNVWRTGTFKMSVDIKHKGMGFVLEENLRAKKGCQVDGVLYTPLTGSGLDEVISEFSSLVKFAQIPVRLNGKLISKNPANMKWDFETEDAYVLIDREKEKPLQVYNLGVLVKEYSNWMYGCGGIVVSKKQLQVNFARNDILLGECKVWSRISENVKAANVSKVANKGSLNSGERRFLASQYVYGNIKDADVDPLDLKLITDVTGRHHTIRDLMKAPRISISSQKQGRTGSQLHRQGKAFMLSEETLTRFSVDDVGELISVLKSSTGYEFPQAMAFEEVAAGFSENFAVIDRNTLTPVEYCVFETLQAYHEKFFAWYSSVERSCGIRELRVGDSNVAKAWTDGRTYITMERGMLTQVAKRGAPAMMDMLCTLTHEYVHDDSDLESHSHDNIFYNKYHDLLQGRGGAGKLMTLALNMTKSLRKAMLAAGLSDERADEQRSGRFASVRRVSKAEKLRLEFAERQLRLSI